MPQLFNALLEHSSISMQVDVYTFQYPSLKRVNLLLQLNPSPTNPRSQVQKKLPKVSVQLALPWQRLGESHSLSAKKLCNTRTSMHAKLDIELNIRMHSSDELEVKPSKQLQ